MKTLSKVSKNVSRFAFVMALMLGFAFSNVSATTPTNPEKDCNCCTQKAEYQSAEADYQAAVDELNRIDKEIAKLKADHEGWEDELATAIDALDQARADGAEESVINDLEDDIQDILEQLRIIESLIEDLEKQRADQNDLIQDLNEIVSKKIAAWDKCCAESEFCECCPVILN